jgi:hypothetical protein
MRIGKARVVLRSLQPNNTFADTFSAEEHPDTSANVRVHTHTNAEYAGALASHTQERSDTVTHTVSLIFQTCALPTELPRRDRVV